MGFGGSGSFRFAPFDTLLRLVLPGLYREPCFPLRRRVSLPALSEEMIRNETDELKVQLETERQHRTGESRPVLTVPQPNTNLPSNAQARSITLQSAASLMNTQSGVQLQVVSNSNSHLSTVTSHGIPSSTYVGGSERRATDLAGTVTDLFGRYAIVQQDLDDPIVAARLNQASQLLQNLNPASAQGLLDQVDNILLEVGNRLKADTFILNQLKRCLFRDLKQTGYINSIATLEMYLAQVDSSGALEWPVASAQWNTFKAQFGADPRNSTAFPTAFTEIAAILDSSGPVQQIQFMGKLTEGDFDQQLLNKIGEIQQAGPKLTWGGLIERALTGEAQDVDHHTIKSSNKTVFFRWGEQNGKNVLEIHGVGQHIGSDNTQYSVERWSSGRKFKIDLNKKKTVVK